MKRKNFLITIIPFVIILIIMPGIKSAASVTAAVIHESGHLLAIKISGKSFNIGQKTGGLQITVREYGSVFKHFAISMSGCTANFLTMALLYITGCQGDFSFYLFYSSLALGIFNLLPVKGLDGGECLEGILDHLLFPRQAYVICRTVSVFFLFLIWCTSVYILMITGDNLSLFAISSIVSASMFSTLI